MFLFTVLLLLLDFGLRTSAMAQGLPSTTYTRSFLRATNNENARSLLGFASSNAVVVDPINQDINWAGFAPTNIGYLSATNATFTGGLTNHSSVGFQGNASGLTNLGAANITAGGTLPVLNAGNLTNLFARRLNVRDYGASTSAAAAANVTAINAAASALHTAGGGMLYVPAGTYQINGTIYLSNNTALVGDGLWNTKLIQTNGTSDNTPILFISNSTNITVADIELDGNQRTRGLTPSINENNAIQADNTTNLTLLSIRCRDVLKDGFNGGNNVNVIVSGSVFDNCGGSGLSTHGDGLTISGNLFTNCGWYLTTTGTHVGGIGDVSSSWSSIVGNVFQNCWQGIWKQQGTGCTIAGNTFYATNGSRTNIFINGATTWTVAGNTMYGGVGVHISGSLAANGVTIEGNQFVCVNGVYINTGTNIVVRGNSFRDSNSGGSGSGVHVSGGGSGEVVVQGNNFYHAVSCVRISSGIHGVTIKDNVFGNNGSGSGQIYNIGSGSNHQISGNVGLYSSINSLYLATGTNCVIQGNRFAGTLWIGGHSNIVAGNVLAGLTISGSGLTNNQFWNNRISGTLTEDSSANVEDQVWNNNRAVNGDLVGVGTLYLNDSLWRVFNGNEITTSATDAQYAPRMVYLGSYGLAGSGGALHKTWGMIYDTVITGGQRYIATDHFRLEKQAQNFRLTATLVGTNTMYGLTLRAGAYDLAANGVHNGVESTGNSFDYTSATTNEVSQTYTLTAPSASYGPWSFAWGHDTGTFTNALWIKRIKLEYW